MSMDDLVNAQAPKFRWIIITGEGNIRATNSIDKAIAAADNDNDVVIDVILGKEVTTSSQIPEL